MIGDLLTGLVVAGLLAIGGFIVGKKRERANQSKRAQEAVERRLRARTQSKGMTDDELARAISGGSDGRSGGV
ncbi:hypothetical protein ATO8_19964 [Roseivivax marinus]|uniref:Uncharacterized protein n=1 Tax=Roseivivax marinus TaxID=1379903 RepID=W4HEV1_9RHOB|nr:hypothetical protein [Roseivivax marinus]ETW10908.1 hypothetical protein ATO8_19964 [Roseivivax marinus]